MGDDYEPLWRKVARPEETHMYESYYAYREWRVTMANYRKAFKNLLHTIIETPIRTIQAWNKAQAQKKKNIAANRTILRNPQLQQLTKNRLENVRQLHHMDHQKNQRKSLNVKMAMGLLGRAKRRRARKRKRHQ